ncbi:restriction endonuclease subunit S [Anoxybacillus flavithermus]|uniref:restriction endonuclease subunit S n=1 Tax=Anoxybacillus flavithermus TaxID=33934 RepID=UPI000B204E88|nr:restriction endonuclease subunit S [Anoxybacillus flavithermus]MBE2956310.1 restriction endonuclease subunit S [Anoxybacillus flavithermus]
MRKVSLGSLVNIRTGKLDANASNPEGKYPFFTCSRETLKIDTYSYDCECVLVAGNGDLNVKYYNGKFDAYQRTYIIESIDKNILNVKYLYYFMQLYVSKLRQMSIGGVIKYIKLNYLTDAKIPLPNIEKQNKIVKVLEKAQELIDKRKAQIEALDQLTQSVFLEMFGDPVSNPKGWPVSNLGNSIKITGGYAFKSSEFEDVGVPVIKIGTVNKGYFDFSTLSYVPEITEKYKKYIIYPGDLLITLTGTVGKEDYGNVCIVPNNFKYYLLNQRVAKIEPIKDFETIYLFYCFKQKKFKNMLTKLSRGIRQANISNEDIKSLMVPLPPLFLQKKFAEIDKQINREKTLLQESLIELEKIFHSLMQRAFKGELFND